MPKKPTSNGTTRKCIGGTIDPATAAHRIRSLIVKSNYSKKRSAKAALRQRAQLGTHRSRSARDKADAHAPKTFIAETSTDFRRLKKGRMYTIQSATTMTILAEFLGYDNGGSGGGGGGGGGVSINYDITHWKRVDNGVKFTKRSSHEYDFFESELR